MGAIRFTMAAISSRISFSENWGCMARRNVTMGVFPVARKIRVECPFLRVSTSHLNRLGLGNLLKDCGVLAVALIRVVLVRSRIQHAGGCIVSRAVATTRRRGACEAKGHATFAGAVRRTLRHGPNIRWRGGKRRSQSFDKTPRPDRSRAWREVERTLGRGWFLIFIRRR